MKDEVNSEALDNLLAMDGELHGVGPDRMDNAASQEAAAADPKAVPLFRVDMSLMPDGQIVGMSLHWNGMAVRSTDFAANVLNEVKRQLDDVAVVHGLLMSALLAADEADRMVQEVSDGAES